MNIAALSPLERLGNVVVNLGLADTLAAGELTLDDTVKVIKCIRDAEPSFPWPDEEIRNRLIQASRMQGEARWWATAFRLREEAIKGARA